jgi:hypothetical protein
MSELDYVGADDLVFNNDTVSGIAAGGFSVNSIMMKAGMSPIMTINNNNAQFGGDSNKVSDLFNNLVVPNWALSYNNRIIGGGKSKEKVRDELESDEDDTIDDDLHDKLLELVKEHNTMVNKKNKITRKHKPISKENIDKITKKTNKGTKKQRSK